MRVSILAILPHKVAFYQLHDTFVYIKIMLVSHTKSKYRVYGKRKK